MTYEEIVTRTKELISVGDFSEAKGHIAVQVNIIGEGEGAFYIEISDGTVAVAPYEYYDRDCIFIVSGKDFLKICEGSLNPVMAFTVGKLKVEGSIEKALAFSDMINSVREKAEKAEKMQKKIAKKK